MQSLIQMKAKSNTEKSLEDTFLKYYLTVLLLDNVNN